MKPKPIPVKALPMPSYSGMTPGLQAEAYAQNLGVTPTSMIWYDPMGAANMILRNIAMDGRNGQCSSLQGKCSPSYKNSNQAIQATNQGFK